MFWSNRPEWHTLGHSKAFQQGASFIETMRLKRGRLLYAEDHLARLYQSMSDFNFVPAWSSSETIIMLQEAIDSSGIENGRVRLQSYDAIGHHDFIIEVDTFTYDAKHLLQEGVVAAISEQRRHSLDPRYRYKLNHHFGHQMASRGLPNVDEWLFVNEHGHITEGVKSNLFWFKDQALHTPALSCNLLPGILRNKMIQQFRKEGFKVVEACYTMEDIQEAEMVFITNALMPVSRIRQIDDHHFGDLLPDILKLIQSID